jgi:putative MATE family efflux protein
VTDTATRVPVRRVLGLALPALGVLAAEPLYVLVDTAVVGHLGAVPLAGLALGGVILSAVSTDLTFLSYGTTARSARLHGAGKRREAVEEGVQATWIAVLVGLALLLVGQLVAGPVVSGLSGDAAVAAKAEQWLRIALCGAPLILITMAGNGWMRGVQDTVRPLRYVLAGNAFSAVLCPVLVFGFHTGIAGSAVANVAAQVIAASLFLRALLAERVSLRPDFAAIRVQLRLGRDLVLRTFGFQVCFFSAAAVAGHVSAATLGAHQVVLQLWNFDSLLLDSLAIAAQSLVGAALGAGRRAEARGLSGQITGYGLGFGVILGGLFAALSGVLPLLFTSDPAVLDEIPKAWWVFVGLQPVAGVVFALDGVLLGAGDAVYLRTTTLLSAVCGFLPVVWLAYAFGWGLLGIWAALATLMLFRLVAVLWRDRSGHWAVTGVVRAA